MKPYVASLINAILLISLGAWAYFSSEKQPPTALIPVGVGVILLAINNGVRKEEKVQAHIAVLLTLLILFGLAMPLKGAIDRGSAVGIARVAAMLLSTVVAMIIFVKSFIDARKRRNAQGT